jgi:hypothetical protein
MMQGKGFGRRHAYDASGDRRWELRRRDVRPPSDSRIETKKPAADFSARAFEDGCDDGAMPVICPTCQILYGNAAAPANAVIQVPGPAARLFLMAASLQPWQVAVS